MGARAGTECLARANHQWPAADQSLRRFLTRQAAQRKALDVLHGLGLSDSLLRVIDRRQKMDVILTYCGMALVAALLLAAWWFLKR